MTDVTAQRLSAERESRVGWIGLGKLGLPCAVTLNVLGGHGVIGTDVDDRVRGYLHDRKVPYREEGLDRLLKDHTIRWVRTVVDVVLNADTIFIAVQTPHHPEFGGEAPFDDAPEDFEYGYLVQAVRDVCEAAERLERYVTVVIISTVLPGTFNRDLRPLRNRYVEFIYNPFFIAMGTVVHDFSYPEFVLLGADDHSSPGVDQVINIYTDLYSAIERYPSYEQMSIASAELTKVGYNTYLTMKIVFANFLAEVADATGADVDEVTNALTKATDRLLSPRYMRAGMGDGGGCHPRDNIAMSHLAEIHRLSFNLAGQMIIAREFQSLKLAWVVTHWAALSKLGIVVLGKSYKPETDLTAGSPALLLYEQIHERMNQIAIYDPYVDDGGDLHLLRGGTWAPSVFVIATNHAVFQTMDFPPGSVVIDPWGDIKSQEGVTLVRPGRR